MSTKLPIELIDPATSTAGLVPVSTGPTTPPAWGTPAPNGVLPILNGGTGQSTQATALAALLGTSTVPVANGGTGVTTAAAELTRIGGAATSGTLAQFAATTSAQLAGVLTDETGTGPNVFATSPTITTPNIVGITNGAAAAAGSVGQIVQSQVTTNTAWAPATNVAGNLTSIPLTAGQWLVFGNVFWAAAAGSAVWLNNSASISTTSATAAPSYELGQFGQVTAGSNNVGYTVPMQILNVPAATTAYLVGLVSYASGTMAYQCNLIAIRIR